MSRPAEEMGSEITTSGTLEDQVLKILQEGLEVEVAPDTDLIGSGLLDSLTFVDLIVRIEEVFGVQVDVGDVELDHFRTPVAIARFLSGQYQVE